MTLLQPWPVFGGFRIARVGMWTLAGRDADQGWDQDYEFVGKRVWPTEAECQAAIERRDFQ